jgi:CheY-like chemotaxis protein
MSISPTGQTRTPQHRVLVVDDDPVTVETFAEWLALSGFAVHTSRDGEAALRLVGSVDAIIVDARMPNIDGFEFLRRVRVSHPDIPAAIITGDYLIDEAAVIECRRLGAALMFKPVWLDDLVTLATQMADGVRQP